MRMDDICLCASKDCPRFNECYRGGLTEKKGIYTISLLAEICNENNNYIMQIKEEE